MRSIRKFVFVDSARDIVIPSSRRLIVSWTRMTLIRKSGFSFAGFTNTLRELFRGRPSGISNFIFFLD